MSNKIMFVRTVSVLLILLCFSPLFTHQCSADELSSARAAILIECNSNRTLYGRNADTRLPMASTTKIMTALTALRYYDPQEELTIPKSAVGIEGTSASLAEGEIYSLEELLYAMLLQSANDAAAAIAINIGGDVDGFAVLMNQTARELGLQNSSFRNPHGLPDEHHYTTARDLALISSHALKNDTIAKITASKTARITSAQGTVRYFQNHNKMLSLYKGADGVKTGFTKASGRCLVSSATRDGLTLVAVTLNSHDDWREHTRMLDWGFENYEAVRASDITPLSFTVAVAGSGDRFLCLTSEDIYLCVKRGERDKIKIINELPRFVYSPKKSGERIGRLLYYYNEEILAEMPVLSESPTPQ